MSAPPVEPQPPPVEPPASVSVPSAAPLVPVYPPPVTAEAGWSKKSGVKVTPVVDTGPPVSSVLLAAYQSAASAVPSSCNLSMTLLAAIGQVESGNLAGHRLDEQHRAVPAILGPVLDGNGFSAIADTDNGAYDGDQEWDRAVGPMQFIPGTWVRFGADLDGDGERNPQDVEDAAGAAAAYLCFGGLDLATDDGLRAAVLSYNHSSAYVDLVLSWKAKYDEEGFGSLATPVVTSAVTSARPVQVTRPPVTPPPSSNGTPVIWVGEAVPEPKGTKTPGELDDLVHPVVDPPADPPVDPPVEEPTDLPTDPPSEAPVEEPAETPTEAPVCETAVEVILDPATGLPVDDPATEVDESCVPPCGVDPEATEPAATAPEPDVEPVLCEPVVETP